MSIKLGRQFKRRALLRSGVGLLLASLIDGCAILQPSTLSATPPPATTNLLLWHGWTGSALQALSQQVEHFNRQAAGGRIILQSVELATFAADLRGAALAGSGPHLVLLPNTWVGQLANDNVLLSIDQQITDDLRRVIIPAALAGAQAVDREGKSHIYGLPLNFDTLALLYNSANVLSPPADTATLLAGTRGLSAPDAQPPIWGLALNLSLDTTIGYLYAFGGRIFDEHGTLAIGSSGRTGVERWLAWVASLANDQHILAQPDSSIIIDHELKSGTALATFDWAHQINTYRNLWGQHLGIAPLPVLSETGRPAQSYVRSDILAINARIGAQERTAALAFLQFMVTEEVQLALLQVDLQPARNVALAENDTHTPIARAFREQALHGLPMPNEVNHGIVDQELRLMLKQVLGGLATPADAVDQAERRLRGRLGLK